MSLLAAWGAAFLALLGLAIGAATIDPPRPAPPPEQWVPPELIEQAIAKRCRGDVNKRFRCEQKIRKALE